MVKKRLRESEFAPTTEVQTCYETGSDRVRKANEIKTPNSCLNRAADDEPIFVLRAHDSCAPFAIFAWAGARVKNGKNETDDPEIQEAIQLATEMVAWRAAKKIRDLLGDRLEGERRT